MCPSLTEIRSKTVEENSAQTNRQYENNGHLAVNQPTNVYTRAVFLLLAPQVSVFV